MWIFTTGGFVSAVQDMDDNNFLVIRSRDRASLQIVFDGVEMLTDTLGEDDEILVGAGTDYPYRLRVTREAFAEWMANEIRQYLDYGNFKDEAHRTLGDVWARSLGDVWVAMLGVTDEEGRQV